MALAFSLLVSYIGLNSSLLIRKRMPQTNAQHYIATDGKTERCGHIWMNTYVWTLSRWPLPASVVTNTTAAATLKECFALDALLLGQPTNLCVLTVDQTR